MPVKQPELSDIFNRVAADPCQSFGINNWCHARAMRMVGVLLREGIEAWDIGWAMIWSPPQSLYPNSPWPVMRSAGVDPFSLKDLLHGQTQIVVGRYLFRQIETSHGADVVILNAHNNGLLDRAFFEENPVRYRFTDPSCGTWWNNHIAPILAVDRCGQIESVVVDPEMADTPLSVGDWRRLQDPLGNTCILIADWTGASRIDDERSSHDVLRKLTKADAPIDLIDPAETIAALTSGAILEARICNPFHPPLVSDQVGVPSIAATSSYFVDWLAPLAAFRKWRVDRVAELMSTQGREIAN